MEYRSRVGGGPARWAIRQVFGLLVVLVSVGACATLTSTPTPTPTQLPTAAPLQTPTASQIPSTPTKAPIPTATKRPLTKVTMSASSLSMAFAPVIIAFREGYFEREGLDVNLVAAGGGAKALAALTGGSAEFANMAASNVVPAVAQGADAQIVAGYFFRGVEQLVVSKKVIQEKGIRLDAPLAEKAKALKGLRIANFSQTGSSYRSFQHILLAAGLDAERDVELTIISDQNALVAALKKGVIDGFMYTPLPTAQVVVDGDAEILVDTGRGDVPSRGESLITNLTIRKAYGGANAPIVEAAVRGAWRGMRLMQRDKVAAAAALRKDDFYREADPKVVLLGIEMLSRALLPDPSLTQRMIQDVIDEWRLEEPERATGIDMTFDKLATNRFVEAARKQLGF
ncbi:MAG: ABC transporter substrate-binding protein [Chloroflexi bacterium]|nr:ABC transporter substrate-binding protein [Chloroflexota bacterium]